jgi:hypothetical protein
MRLLVFGARSTAVFFFKKKKKKQLALIDQIARQRSGRHSS